MNQESEIESPKYCRGCTFSTLRHSANFGVGVTCDDKGRFLCRHDRSSFIVNHDDLVNGPQKYFKSCEECRLDESLCGKEGRWYVDEEMRIKIHEEKWEAERAANEAKLEEVLTPRRKPTLLERIFGSNS